jgi:hypothetical protein
MAVAMYVFSRKSLYKAESAIFQLKCYHVKDYFFLKLKINMVDSFRQNLMILQVWSLWVDLLPVLLFHIAMIISTCYLENGSKVKDHSRPWPLNHRLLSHQHGNILGTQMCFLLTEKIRWFTKLLKLKINMVDSFKQN